MRTPSLFKKCLPGLVPQDRRSGYPSRYVGENIDWQGVNEFKGKFSVLDIIGSELISSKADASLKSMDSSLDLVNILKHEIRDAQLSFRGKRVLELGCGYGIPGIFACLKGASIVHFQDINADNIRCTTIPNVLANLEQARDRQSRQPESPLTPSRQIISPALHFYAGEWEELAGVLSVMKNDIPEVNLCDDKGFISGYPSRYVGENIDWQGVNEFKGKVSVLDIIGSELISSKADASLKSMDSSLDLVNILKHEIRDAQLSFRGKRVLELGCGYGIPGIFACLKGASIVHFQDINADNIRCTTIPNVLANLEQARDRQSRQPESPLTPSRQIISPAVHFYAGEWEELAGVLSVMKNDIPEVASAMTLSGDQRGFQEVGCGRGLMRQMLEEDMTSY
nr:histidine protein methyltransferase 1 homolog [Tanacetum cinerariifolium]